MALNVSKIVLNDNNYLMYKQYKSKKNQDKPGVIFIHGFRSDMLGEKVQAIEQFCIHTDIDFIAFDCLNHGMSSGDRQGGNISLWRKNFTSILDELVEKPFIFVGSSMGGWLSLLGALDRPDLCYAVIGIAPAPDFTEDIWANFNDKERQEINEKGITKLNSEWCTSEYLITKEFIEDGKNNLLLTHNEKIEINKPVRLIHGLMDKDVPYQTSMKILNNIQSTDVQSIFIKDGEHRLSRPQDLTLIVQAIHNLI